VGAIVRNGKRLVLVVFSVMVAMAVVVYSEGYIKKRMFQKELREMDAEFLRTPFVIANDVKDMPQGVLGGFLKDGISNPGKPYNESCSKVVASKESRLPDCRLIYAGVSPKYCFVFFESFGYARHCVVNAYRMDGERADLMWSVEPGGLNPKQFGPEELKLALSSMDLRRNGNQQ
jgi:hypothetical protein